MICSSCRRYDTRRSCRRFRSAGRCQPSAVRRSFRSAGRCQPQPDGAADGGDGAADVLPARQGRRRAGKTSPRRLRAEKRRRAGKRGKRCGRDLRPPQDCCWHCGRARRCGRPSSMSPMTLHSFPCVDSGGQRERVPGAGPAWFISA